MTASTTGNGGRLRRRAERLGWEGLVAKEPLARYVDGRRHAAWRKLKFTRTEQFVVGGWTDPAAARTGFGALLLGYHPDTAAAGGASRRSAAPSSPAPLVFAGQVGSGFTQAELERIAARLAELAADRSPFADAPAARGRHHWVRPVLVAEVRFTEWTFDGLLRNPVHLRLRDDKPAASVRLRQRPGRATRASGAAQRGPAPPDPPDPALAALLDTIADLEQRRAGGTLVLPDGARVAVGNLEKVFGPTRASPRASCSGFRCASRRISCPSSPTGRSS